ncbi:Thioredoxin-like fold [Phytophthora cactorum]|nr:Thioredoxin-like fold [Phytophthora cactorum]
MEKGGFAPQRPSLKILRRGYSHSIKVVIARDALGAKINNGCDAVLGLDGAVPHLLERGVEIVLVGSDKTQEAHNAYRSQQPRPAGRFDDDIRIELRDEFYVNPIPTLIFVGQEGTL